MTPSIDGSQLEVHRKGKSDDDSSANIQQNGAPNRERSCSNSGHRGPCHCLKVRKYLEVAYCKSPESGRGKLSLLPSDTGSLTGLLNVHHQQTLEVAMCSPLSRKEEEIGHGPEDLRETPFH